MLLIVHDYLLGRPRGRTIGDEIFKSAIGASEAARVVCSSGGDPAAGLLGIPSALRRINIGIALLISFHTMASLRFT